MWITYHCHSRIYGIYQRFVYPFHLKAITSLYFLRFYLICPTCFHKWPRMFSTYVNTFQSFPHPRFITGFVTRVIRRVPLVQQNCWSLRTTWVHLRLLVGFVLLCYCNTLLIVDCPFVLSRLAIVLSVLLRFTDYEYPFGISNASYVALWWILILINYIIKYMYSNTVHITLNLDN